MLQRCSTIPHPQVIEELLRCNPYSNRETAMIEVTVAESSGVVVQEATSRKVTLQQIAHEEWLRVPVLVKGRVELQIKCRRPDNKSFILGKGLPCGFCAVRACLVYAHLDLPTRVPCFPGRSMRNG